MKIILRGGTLLLIVMLIFTGCMGTPETSESTANISIHPLSIDHEEYSIMRAAGIDQSMIFTVDSGNQKISKITVWIDHYVKGNFKGKILSFEASAEPKEKQHKIYLSRMIEDNDDHKTQVWNLAVRSSKGVVSTRTELTSTVTTTSEMTTPTSTDHVQLNHVVEIGVIAKNKGNSISFGTTSEAIETNDEVYVLRCKVS